MIVETARFGRIEVGDDSIIRMPRGMFGFEDETDYCLVQNKPDMVFKWLQSVTDPGLAFVVVDPSHFFDDYEFRLSSVEAESVGLTASEDAMVLTTVSIAGPSEVTANLAGPVVINTKSLLGMQVALEDERYGTRHALGSKDESAGVELRKAA